MQVAKVFRLSLASKLLAINPSKRLQCGIFEKCLEFGRTEGNEKTLIPNIRHASFATSTTTQEKPDGHAEIIDSVNKIIESKDLGQTFAVVHFYGKEFLIHLGDIICVEKAVPVEIGERIKLEKCMLFGNSDFSLIGRPVLNRDLVQIEATVIEKTMSQTFFNMLHVPRDRGNRRYRFQRNPQTMLRISEIKICHPLNHTQKRIN